MTTGVWACRPRPKNLITKPRPTPARCLQYLGVFIAIIMAVGSSFAAMNTMYAAVARRATEIGTLRVLGFSQASILLSFLFESLLLALLGGLVGCVLVLPLNNITTGVGSFVTFSEIAFNFRVSPAIMLDRRCVCAGDGRSRRTLPGPDGRAKRNPGSPARDLTPCQPRNSRIFRLTEENDGPTNRRPGPCAGSSSASRSSSLLGAARFIYAKLTEATEVQIVRVHAASQLPAGEGNVILNATGYIVAAHKIELAAKVVGKVAWIGVDKGDQVKAGQVLVRLEDDEYRAHLLESKGNLEI